jgi:hypothetical protein
MCRRYHPGRREGQRESGILGRKRWNAREVINEGKRWQMGNGRIIGRSGSRNDTQTLRPTVVTECGNLRG